MEVGLAVMREILTQREIRDSYQDQNLNNSIRKVKQLPEEIRVEEVEVEIKDLTETLSKLKLKLIIQ